MTKSLCKCGAISVEELIRCVDDIDTILLIKNTIADTLSTKANFTAKLHTNGQTRIKKFSTINKNKKFSNL